MTNWSQEDDDDTQFVVKPSYFTITNYPEVASEINEDERDCNYWTEGPSTQEENHFYKLLGFKVGLVFEGDKKICLSKKPNNN